MKKTILLFVLILLTVSSSFSQKNVTGLWLMTRTETPQGTQEPYFTTHIAPGGKLFMMGMELGTWKYDAATHTLEFFSDFPGNNFKGPFKVEKAEKQRLELSQKENRFFFTRLDSLETVRDNEHAPIVGVWNIDDPEGTAILRFTLPDDFAYIRNSQGVTDTYNGTWIWRPASSEVILMGVNAELRGKHKVDIGKGTITLDPGKENQLTGTRGKEEKESGPVMLTFQEEEFPEESDPGQLPVNWNTAGELAESFEPVKMLVYHYGIWNNDMEKMIWKQKLLRVQADPEKPSVRITKYTVEENDTTQYAEKYKGGLSGMYDLFFPASEIGPFRVTGREEITVPAGTFNCTVVEGFDGYTKVKYWMINDKPGFYARIIRQDTDPFGELSYTLEELQEIR